MTQLLLISLLWLIPGHTPGAGSNECVILLHGLGRTSYSMNKIEAALLERGYRVWNQSYPSTSAKIETLAPDAIHPATEYCQQTQTTRTHFVTHSLGGILVRYYLQDHRIDTLGRIVMISPPNKGSEIADLLRGSTLATKLLGPTVEQLGTDPRSLPNQLAPIQAEIGIITGISSSDPWFSPIIPGDDDGKVSVESARLEEMAAFLEVDSGHTFIMRNQEVINQIAYFLGAGSFAN